MSVWGIDSGSEDASAPRVVVALDELRCGWLRIASRAPGFAWWFPHARRRLALAGLATFAGAVVSASAAPVTFLLASTLVLGPIHLLAHMRYLPALAATGSDRARSGVVSYAPFFLLCSLAACVLLTGWSSSTVMGAPMQVVLFRGAAVVLACVTLFRTVRGVPVRAALPGLVLALSTWACAASAQGLLALTFLHNLVAFVYWISAARQGDMARFAWRSLALGVAGLLGLILVPWERVPFYGVVDLMVWSRDAWNEAFVRQTANVPPGLADEAPRLLTVFAVSQALHYFVWLRGIPDAMAVRGVPRPFRSTWRMLCARVGRTGLAVWALSSAGFLAWALRDPEAARECYLAFAIVHALAEIACFRHSAIDTP